jgi:formylglycine-generating enzyme required for sulfatase activity
LLAGLLIASSLVLAAGASGATEANESSAMVSVSGGSFVPHYGDADDRVPVDAFRMDVHPVTNADFFRFVSRHPRWQRERIVGSIREGTSESRINSVLSPGSSRLLSSALAAAMFIASAGEITITR